jgi:hypothetical protein
VSAKEEDTSRSTSPAGASPCHGRGHALGRGETAVHALANADRRSAVHRHEQGLELIPLLPQKPFLSFSEKQPKFEQKSNFYQNKSCTKFCELQNIFKDQRQI